MGTTVKINARDLQGAQGLRVGIYPMVGPGDVPRRDDDLNLIRLPLPYDGQFMEVFYKAFFLTRAFLKADARVPRPADLPDAEDRFLMEQLAHRRDLPIVEVLEALRDMGQPGLVETSSVFEEPVGATLSTQGLDIRQQRLDLDDAVSVSLAPSAKSG